jgi:hypothetical protein
MKVQPFVDQLEHHENQSDKKYREFADSEEAMEDIRLGEDL